MTWIIAATYLGGYRLSLTFNDGFVSTVDLFETLANDHRPILNSHATVDEFAMFRVENDTIVWKNGADLSPEFLRTLAEKKTSDVLSHATT